MTLCPECVAELHMKQTPFAVAFLGVDHPHGAAWRELFTHPDTPVELTAVVPGLEGTLASMEERYAQVPRFDSVEALLSSGIPFEGAIVCLDNRATPAAVEQLALAGKHVLVEKPGAVTAAAFAPAAAAIRTRQVAFQSGYVWRYHPMTHRLRQMIAEKRCGKIISVLVHQTTADVQRRGSTHFLFDPHRSGRGFFHWLACHWIDWVPFVLDDPIVAVTARLGRYGEVPVTVDDGGTAILETASGVLVTITGGYWLPRWTGELRLTLYGSHRWLEWEPQHPGTGGRLRIHGPQPHFHAMEEVFDLPPDATRGYGGIMGLAALRDWIATARGILRTTYNSLDSFLAALRVLDAAYQSAAEGRRVTL